MFSVCDIDDDNETLFQFDKNRDAPPQYVIMNYQKKERASNGSDKYYWRSVGTYESKYLLHLQPTLHQIFNVNKKREII